MKKIIAYPLIGLVILAGSYFFYTRFSASTSTTGGANSIITVSSGSIRNTVKATGLINAVQQSNLTFTRQGTITGIYKKVGDTVKAGDLIAEVDDTSAKLAVASAEVALSNAQNTLNTLNGGSIALSKVQSSNTLADAQAKLTLLESQYETLLATQKNTLASDQANIVALQASLDLAKSQESYTAQSISGSTDTSTNNLVRDVANGYGLIIQVSQWIPDTLKVLHDILLIDNKSDQSYGDLGATDLTNKANAEALYQAIVTKNTTLTNSLPSIVAGQTSLDTILSGLSQTADILNSINTLIALSINEERTSSQTAALPYSVINTNIATLQTLSNSLSTKVSNTTSSIANLRNYGSNSITALANKNTLSAAISAVTTAQNNLNKAKQSLENDQKSYASQILSAQQGIESQKNLINLNTVSYQNTLNTTNTSLVNAQNAVKSANIGLEQAKLTLRDYQIYATFDGVVIDIPWTIGDTLVSSNSTTSKNISITNSGGYEVDVTLDQADVVKVQPGMPARIALDAYSGLSFSGVVSSVSPTPTVTSNVVSYTAKVFLPKIDKTVYTSMSATVSITTSEVNGVIVVPSRAVKQIRWKTYLQVVTTDSPTATPTQIEVSLGITDGNIVEVLSGVTVWQKILIPSGGWTRSGSGGTNKNPQATPNILGWFGWGGGGGGGWRGGG